MAQQEAATFEAQQARLNERLAKEAREDALRRGEEDVRKFRRETSVLLGRQRAIYGASGVDVGSGSVQDVQRGTEKYSEADVQTLRNNAAREAWGYEAQATQFAEQAAFAEKRGKNAFTNSFIGGLFGGASAAAGTAATLARRS